jgi:hypothetical protein
MDYEQKKIILSIGKSLFLFRHLYLGEFQREVSENFEEPSWPVKISLANYTSRLYTQGGFTKGERTPSLLYI